MFKFQCTLQCAGYTVCFNTGSRGRLVKLQRPSGTSTHNEFKIPSSPIQVEDSVSADTSSRFCRRRYKLRILSVQIQVQDSVAREAHQMSRMPTMWRLRRPTETFKSNLRRLMCGAIGSGDEAKHSDNRPKSDAFKIESRNYFCGGNPSLGVQQCYELVNKFVKE